MSLLHLFKLNNIYVFFIFITIIIIIDLIIWFEILNINRKKNIVKIIQSIHLLLTGIIVAVLIWAFFIKNWIQDPVDFSVFYRITNFFTLLYLTKIIFVILSLPLLFRHFKYYVKFIIVFTLLFFFMLMYGLYFGRFNFHKNILHINNQFMSNQQIKIVHISDLHVGQYINHEKRFSEIIDCINNENPDIIFFTGDMICNFAQELKPFLPYFSKLKAKYGVFAVHGNHDYGDYFWWKNDNEKNNNHLLLENYYNQLNFKLLNNTIDTLTLKNQSILIAGIENFGPKPYPSYGNITKALANTDTNKFVILLAHDPFIWKTITQSYKQVKLTLSGHTHGYQFGLCTQNKCWSPFMPKKPWKGLYQDGDQYLYISAGLSSSFFSPRIGIWPEITVINLH